jgi:DNA processing protein
LAAEANYEKSRAFFREGGGSSAFGSTSDAAAWRGWSEAEARRIGELGDRAVSGSALSDRPWLDAAGLVTAFFEGDLASLARPRIGIVGTRAASSYGKSVAKRFGEAFALAGVTVVSGGALGIDAAAHEGALVAAGRTVAVLGGGLDRLYPNANVGLFVRLREQGGLLSGFAFGAAPDRFNFLKRNRLIAALSEAVVVIEAPERSGALSTLHAALEFGRPVFAVPGTIEKENFRGSHRAIREGRATLVDAPEQVLGALGLAASPVPASEPSSELGAQILASLTVEPQPLEKLAELAGIDAAELMSELTMLELDGLVVRDLGGYARPG